MIRARQTLSALIAAVVACGALATPAHAQRRSILERYQTKQEMDARHFGFLQNGYHMTDLETCREPGAVWWVAVYEHYDDPPGEGGFDHIVELGSWNDANQEISQQALRGWFLDDLNAASDGSAWSHHTAIFNEYPGANQHVIRETDFTRFNEIRQSMNAAGLRLIDIDVSNISGVTRFYGVMRAGTQDERLIHEPTWATFSTVRAHMEANGWRVRDIAAQQGAYVAVLNQGSGPSSTEIFQDWPSLTTHWAAIDANRRINTRLKDVECWVEGGQLRYAALFRGAPRTRVGREAIRPGSVAAQPTPAPQPAPTGPVADPDPN